jgi:BirA family transcriptional regulator, biotin operon repressor / biotin---[acetyl-CoA-carboxylase] ligase
MSALDIERVRRAFPGRRIDYYDSIGSTMTAAIGLPLGTAVVAGEQTSGQGRLGRAWHSEAGSGLYCTMVLTPSPVLTLALGLAARSAILKITGLDCDIRWPNDLMLDEKKVAGILVQVVDGLALAGVGINVNQEQFPPEIASLATSLRLAQRARGGAGCQPAADRQSAHSAEDQPGLAREDLLIALLHAADEFTPLDRESILRLFTEASSYARGRRVTVDQTGGQLHGVTNGLDKAGFLRLRTDDGADTLILAGGVRAAGS